MFDHISIKVANARTTIDFYLAALEPLGIDRKFEAERPDGVIAGYGRDRVNFFIGEGTAATYTPIHIALQAQDRAQVDAFHAAAVAAGGRNNGAPGVRAKYHDRYYAAYVIDPAGNNLEVVFQG